MERQPAPTLVTMSHAASTFRSIPRQEWSSHPNYPNNLLLLGSHQNFLAINRRLVEQVQRQAEGSDLSWFARTYSSWIRAMRSHEAYEEHKLYPYLQARWGVSMAPAQAGHETLHEAHARVMSAFDTHDSVEAAAALLRHEEVLAEHLELEEQLVIPMLLELPRDEFLKFTHRSIHLLLRELNASA